MSLALAESVAPVPRSSMLTVGQALRAIAGRDDVPTHLRFWLECTPHTTVWTNAPRPDWLAYLAQFDHSVGKVMLAEVRARAKYALTAPTRDVRQDGLMASECVLRTPLCDAAEEIRRTLSGRRAA